MGIKQLFSVIEKIAPNSIYTINDRKQLNDQRIAVDIFVILHRFIKGNLVGVHPYIIPQEQKHIVGLLEHVIQLKENYISPCFVFDGTPPNIKNMELQKRALKYKQNQNKFEYFSQLLNEIRDENNRNINDEEQQQQQHQEKQKKEVEEEEKLLVEKLKVLQMRMSKLTREHIQECKELLDILGIPYIEAPGEAEAQCASMCKNGIVDAVLSDDMDTLTFGAPILLRKNFVFCKFINRTNVGVVINLEQFLIHTGFNMNQFIDLCILLGSDYCPKIKRVGSKTAFAMIKRYGDIETFIKNESKKYRIPEDWNYQEARNAFMFPLVNKDITSEDIWLKQHKPDLHRLKLFLVNQKNINSDYINKCIWRLKKMSSSSSRRQINED